MHRPPRVSLLAAVSVNTTEGWRTVAGTFHRDDLTFLTLDGLRETHPDSILLQMSVFYYGEGDGVGDE